MAYNSLELIDELNKIKEKYGINQTEIAKALKFSRSQISKIFNNKRRITNKSIEEICKSFELSNEEKNKLLSLSSSHAELSTAPLPEKMPPDISYFKGRTRLLSELEKKLRTPNNSPTVVIIRGRGGVGKSTLAARLVYRLHKKDVFPDRIYWTNLRDETPNAALSRWLRYHLNPVEIPDTLIERQNLMARQLAGKKALVVLDNVQTNEQFTQIYGAVDKVAVIVTTRFYFPDLPADYQSVPLGDLEPKESVQVLKALAPVRARQKEQLLIVAELCGYMPLALKLAGTRLKHGEWSQRPLSYFIDSLQKARRDTLRIKDHPDFDIFINSKLSYEQLIEDKKNDAVELFPIFGLFHFPDWSETLIAALIGNKVRKALPALIEYALIEDPLDNRYRLHDLIHDYAEYRLNCEFTPGEILETKIRVANYYSNLLNKYQNPYAYFDKETLSSILPEVENIKVILKWYEEQNKWSEFISLAKGFCSFLTSISRWSEVIEWGGKAAQIAEKIKDDFTIAHLYSYTLAWPLWMRGDYQKARDYCHRGLEAAQRINNPEYMCFATHNLHKTALEEAQNTTDENLAKQCLREMKYYAEQCIQFAQQTNNQTLQGMAYGDAGYASLKVAKYKEAEDRFRKRLAIVEETNQSVHIAARLLDVAIALLGQKDYNEARSFFEKAKIMSENLGRNDITAEILLGLARIDKLYGDIASAQEKEAKAKKLWDDTGLKRDPFVNILDKPESDE